MPVWPPGILTLVLMHKQPKQKTFYLHGQCSLPPELVCKVVHLLLQKFSMASLIFLNLCSLIHGRSMRDLFGQFVKYFSLNLLTFLTSHKLQFSAWPNFGSFFVSLTKVPMKMRERERVREIYYSETAV